jgi:hypothetical protein
MNHLRFTYTNPFTAIPKIDSNNMPSTWGISGSASLGIALSNIQIEPRVSSILLMNAPSNEKRL